MGTSYKYPVRDAGRLSDIEILAEAHEIVEAFLELIRVERVGNDILDIRTLSASRASLENSFRLVIATEPRKQARARLMTAGLMLARFQPDVGQRMSIAPAPQPGSSDTAQNASEREFHRFDAALSNLARDMQRLRNVFTESEEIAERRFAPLAGKPPFREDGTYTWYGHH